MERLIIDSKAIELVSRLEAEGNQPLSLEDELKQKWGEY